MAKASAFDGNFQTFGRMMALHGVVVVMVDFRNSTVPSRPQESIAAFPGGLNDCVCSVRWVVANRPFVGGGTHSRIILAGESGGGNLCIATALKLKEMNDLSCVQGIYSMCPFISGQYALDVTGVSQHYPSLSAYPMGCNGIVLNSVMMQTFAAGYGDGLANEKLAWPSNCTVADVTGLCPIVISVNEFDPLKDEGVAFYDKCVSGQVEARCVVVKGTVHATDNYFVGTAPCLSRETALNIARFAKGDETAAAQSKI
jgi:acetyl esterase/lipase